MKARHAILFVIITSVCGSACTLETTTVVYTPPAEMTSIVRSEHLTIHSDFEPAEVERYRRIFEGFYAYFAREWFPIGQDKPLTMLLFKDPALFASWNKHHGLSSAMGRYFAGRNLITVSAGTGLGTSLHELVHHFVHTAFERRPTGFVNEGIASFFEKVIGHLDDKSELHLTVGYFSPWRFATTKNTHARFSIVSLWNAEYADIDWNIARSFMLFLHRRDQLKPFVRGLIRAKGDGRSEVESVCNQTLAEIESDWHCWVAAQPLDADVGLVQRAFVHDETEWREWLARTATELEFDKKLGIYRARR